MIYLRRLKFVLNGEGEGEGEKCEGGENEREPTLSPQSLSLFPFLPIPYPFRCMLRGLLFSWRVKQEPKKVSAPRRGRRLGGNTGRGLPRLAKCFQRVFSKELTLN